MDRIIEAIISDYSSIAAGSGQKRDYNTLGIVSAGYGRYATAERAFNTALAMDRNYLSPLINLGNVYFLQNQYQSALRNYHRAEENLLARNRGDTPTFQRVNGDKDFHEDLEEPLNQGKKTFFKKPFFKDNLDYPTFLRAKAD